MILKQIKHGGDNFSYIIADEGTGEAAVIDPSYNADAIIKFAMERKLKVEYIIATHHHRDHTAGMKEIKCVLGSKSVIYRSSKERWDIGVLDGEILKVGKVSIKVIHTPGHTSDSICLLAGNVLLTGDTLFVGECGRTDLPDSNPEEMYDSLFNKLMVLDDAVEVYPGHDYGDKPSSTIGEQRRTNYTLKKRSLEEFVRFMEEP